MKVIAYVRVSTDDQASSGLGLEAQQDTLANNGRVKGWELVATCVDAGATGKTLDRPGLQEALARLKRGEAEALVVAKLDRVSRSVVDFGSLLETAKKQGWAFVALDLGVDTTTATGELVANVMMSVAQWERRTIGQRTKDALQAKKRRGARLGRPVVVPAHVRAQVARWRAAGATCQAIADALNSASIPTAHGGQRWRASTVRSVLGSIALDDEAERYRSETGVA